MKRVLSMNCSGFVRPNVGSDYTPKRGCVLCITLAESGIDQRITSTENLADDRGKFVWGQCLQSKRMPTILVTKFGVLDFCFSLWHDIQLPTSSFPPYRLEVVTDRLHV